MAKKIGIRMNAIQIRISGARVAFDPRTTAEVCDSRDDKNYMSAEKAWRTAQWEDRQREKRAGRQAAE